MTLRATMKVHKEANVEGQIQELKTITRLQGESHAQDPPLATEIGGSWCRAFRFNTRTCWGRRLAILLPTPTPRDHHGKGAVQRRGL